MQMECGMEDDLFKKKLGYPYEKNKSIKPFHVSLNLKRIEFFSTLKQSTTSDERISRTRIKFEKYNPTKVKELTIIYLKRDVNLLTFFFRII